MELSAFPAINASLNATSFVLLVLGYTLIRQRAITAHTVAMIAACVTTLIFLCCYIYYHAHHGTTRFPGHGPVKALYLTILVSHTILAAVNAPFVVRTLYFALKGDFYRHAKSARLNFPIWLYVSVTGVVVYWMLYRTTYR